MIMRIFKGLCGVGSLMAGGGALIQASHQASTGAPGSPSMLIGLFVLAAAGGIWLFLEAITGQNIL